MKSLALLAILAAPGFACAAERAVTVTDFDRVRVDGNYVVELTTGKGSSGRIIGSPQAIDAVSIEVQGRTLIVRKSRSSWGGFPGAATAQARVVLTTSILNSAWVTGASTLKVDKMRSARVAILLDGAGRLDVAAIQSDRLDIAISGSGRMTLAGTTADLNAAVRGSADLDTSGLAAADVKLTGETAGNITLAARRSANIVASGSGSVKILGTPACTVKNLGSGTVACGK